MKYDLREIEKDIFAVAGNKFYVPKDYQDDFIGKMLIAGKLFESNLIPIMTELIQPGTIVVDCGTFMGTHAVWMSKIAKKVYAFEPQKEFYDQTMITLELNNCRNVLFSDIALSDGSGRLSKRKDLKKRLFNLSHKNLGACFLKKDENGDIEAKKLDDVLSLVVEEISFIKIDVEEMEFEVLTGAIETLKRHKPSLYVEDLADKHRLYEGRREAIHKLLTDLGYAKYKNHHEFWKHKDNVKK